LKPNPATTENSAQTARQKRSAFPENHACREPVTEFFNSLSGGCLADIVVMAGRLFLACDHWQVEGGDRLLALGARARSGRQGREVWRELRHGPDASSWNWPSRAFYRSVQLIQISQPD